MCLVLICAALLFSVRIVSAQTFEACATSSRAPVCQVARDWDVDEIESLLAGEATAVIADVAAEELTFLFAGAVDGVAICCGLAQRLDRVGESDYWALMLRIRDLAKAVISYRFVTAVDGQGGEVPGGVWRGSEAPPPVEVAEVLMGRIEEYSFESEALGETRAITVYLPPEYDPDGVYPVLYATDGETVEPFARVIEPLIRDETIPPLVMIGTHSASGSGRADEYIPNLNEAAFTAHEAFFTQEVRVWAEEMLGASTARDDRIVFGFSNGGVFSTAMGLRHPDLYSNVVSFSPGAPPGLLDLSAPAQARYYFAAGTLELEFIRNTARVADGLRSAGLDVFEARYVSGHDFVMWGEALPLALRWVFGV